MRLRINAPTRFARPIIGALVAGEPNVLILETSKERLAVPREAIQQLELSERRSSKKKGALIGLAVGSGTALALLYSLCASALGCEGADAYRVAAVTGALGGLGAAIGAGIAPGERWVELRSPTTIAARRHRVQGLRFTLAFRL